MTWSEYDEPLPFEAIYPWDPVTMAIKYGVEVEHCEECAQEPPC